MYWVYLICIPNSLYIRNYKGILYTIRHLCNKIIIVILCTQINMSLRNAMIYFNQMSENKNRWWHAKFIFTETRIWITNMCVVYSEGGEFSHSNFEQQEDYGNHEIALFRSVWPEHWTVFSPLFHRHHRRRSHNTLLILYYVVMHSYILCILFGSGRRHNNNNIIIRRGFK